MQSISFECEVITPMFLGGADGKSAELRAPSIKGALRFWWRAMNGHLSLLDLHTREAEIFGSSNGGRSKVIVRVVSNNISSGSFTPVPHKNYTSEAIKPGQLFTCIISCSKELSEAMKGLFQLVALLGGLGKRVRRGMGSFKITNSQSFSNIDLNSILNLLNTVTPNRFKLVSNSLIQPQIPSVSKYPHILQIQIGRPNTNILKKISDTTHDFKYNNAYRNDYDTSIGFALGQKRLASPVYVSTIKTGLGLMPIITTLYCAPERDGKSISKELQENFKRSIL